MKKPIGNGRLTKSIDQRVARLMDQYQQEGNQNMTTSNLYEYIQISDVSMRRMKKLQLEKTIEKLLPDFQNVKVNQESEQPVSSDEEGEYATPVQETNAMNKSMTKLWNLSMNQAKPAPESPNVQEQVLENENTDAATTVAAADQEVKTKKRSKYSTGGTHKRVRTENKSSGPPPPPSKRLSDLGGIEACIEEVMELIAMPLAHPEVYIHTGVQPPRGILLHGPPGCGKTMLAHAIAGEMGVPFYNISAPSIVSGMSGESEKKIRDVFEEAKDNAPCLLFIDEIDAITPKRETAQREMERRIVAQLLTCMDDLSWDKTGNKPVMIIGATNRPDSLDPALRRAGRFDKEISLGVPDERAREKILTVLAEKLRLEGDFDFAALAKATPGYVGADLQALITAAGVIAVKRIFKHLRAISVLPTVSAPENAEAVTNDESMDIDQTSEPLESGTEVNNIPVQTTSVEEFESQTALEQLRSISEFIKSHKEPLTPAQLESLAITSDDFKLALLKVQPSSKREGFATVPDVNWEDIGALGFVRDELRMAVVEPINHPEFFERVGITAPAGVLLWGPPGCGKTLLAKAVANESNTNFISVKGPELLNKYVGESERGVRQVFARARASAPCVIFFDELDALCSRRDDQQSDASARVVNTLLTELDGAENRSQVYVIAATNRPDMIDPAMLRPGRLDKLLYVELPTAGERFDILKKLTKKSPLIEDLSLETLANDHRCDGFSGADLASLVREAAVAALRKTFYLHGTTLSEEDKRSHKEIFITMKDFDTAFEKVSPSVSKQDKRHYDALRVKLGCPMPPSAHATKPVVAAE